jgi:hypothetical protein
MATNLPVSLRYATHLPCLMKAMEKTTGDVLELGTGIFSTPYLHYQCILSGRKLVSYENFKLWYEFLMKYGYEKDGHEIHFVEKYSDAPIEKPWDVVLIDQTPDSSRAEEIKRIANLAKFVIIHDSNGRYNKIYHYDTIYPLFKYRTIWDKDGNHASVLSNFVDLEDFWK